ncbi:hypothetical protein E5288_WYG001161 [Bos mutus]|uniref:Uncharacterized protein n=1 Tax=Bos mutus TaxID=72004 RepID=A0A6B0S259_9CETA|nr:hypothetical protein [Bos mutus]
MALECESLAPGNGFLHSTRRSWKWAEWPQKLLGLVSDAGAMFQGRVLDPPLTIPVVDWMPSERNSPVLALSYPQHTGNSITLRPTFNGFLFDSPEKGSARRWGAKCSTPPAISVLEPV